MTQELSSRTRNLLAALSQGIYEKEGIMSLSLLAAVAGESILLLGPPGVGKSMIARRMKWAFRSARSFEYLMSRFSTPDELFGPVSIARLRDTDDYVRTTDGYLPTADVVFLDEIWKAGPAIQNALLTVLNERLFRNGREELRLPLKLLIAASNELPARGEGLEALWDRFLLRMECAPVVQEAAFDSLLKEQDADIDLEALAPWQISSEEFAQWQAAQRLITLPPRTMQTIHLIRRGLQSVALEGTDERVAVYVSDRRWRHIGRLLRAEALLQDRQEVEPLDLLPLWHCLWQETAERTDVRRLVRHAIVAPVADEVKKLSAALKEDISRRRTTTGGQPRLYDDEGRPVVHRSVDEYYEELEQLAVAVEKCATALASHLFVSPLERGELSHDLSLLSRAIAFARQDLGKLG